MAYSAIRSATNGAINITLNITDKFLWIYKKIILVEDPYGNAFAGSAATLIEVGIYIYSGSPYLDSSVPLRFLVPATVAMSGIVPILMTSEPFERLSDFCARKSSETLPKRVHHFASCCLFPEKFKNSISDFVGNNDLIALEVYLENVGSLMDEMSDDNTLIEYVICNGTPEMVEFLLSRVRDIDPVLQTLCVKGLLKTEKFSEMIGPIVDADIFSKNISHHDTALCQELILEKIVTSTNTVEYFQYLDIYKTLIDQIRVKIEEDVQVHMEEFPILLEELQERGVAQARRERLQKERIFNPFDLARSFGEDGKLLVALVNNGDTVGIQELMEKVEGDNRSLIDDLDTESSASDHDILEEELNENQEFYQLAKHFKTVCENPTLFEGLREILESSTIDGIA